MGIILSCGLWGIEHHPWSPPSRCQELPSPILTTENTSSCWQVSPGDKLIVSENQCSPLCKILAHKVCVLLGSSGTPGSQPCPSQPWLWQLSLSPHVPLVQVTVGCGSLQPSVTGYSSSHESRGSRYISGPQTALTCSEAECSWPSGFQMLWPQNSTYQGALLLESSGVCLPLGPVCRERIVSGQVFSNLSSPSFFVGSSVYDCSCFSTLAVVCVIQRFTTL